MYFYRNGLPVYKEMKWLAEVKRFSMAVMFLSEKDKQGKYLTMLHAIQSLPSLYPVRCGVLFWLWHHNYDNPL